MNYEEAIKSIKKSEGDIQSLNGNVQSINKDIQTVNGNIQSLNGEVYDLKHGIVIDCGNFGDPVDEEQYDGGEF